MQDTRSQLSREALNKQSFTCGAWMHHHFSSGERWASLPIKGARNAKRSDPCKSSSDLLDPCKSQERLVQRIPMCWMAGFRGEQA